MRAGRRCGALAACAMGTQRCAAGSWGAEIVLVLHLPAWVLMLH